ISARARLSMVRAGVEVSGQVRHSVAQEVSAQAHLSAARLVEEASILGRFSTTRSAITTPAPASSSAFRLAGITPTTMIRFGIQDILITLIRRIARSMWMSPHTLSEDTEMI